MSPHTVLWTIFCTVVPLIMAFDLMVLQRKAHSIGLREASLWTAFWVGLALAFNGLVYYFLGSEKALEFLTAYLIEESLSLDNMFVFILIFSYFSVPPENQPRILHWGILGAIVMRLFFIFAGVALLNKFHWMIYLFGGVLVITGIRMAVDQEQKIDPESNIAIRVLRYFMPILKQHSGTEFFVRVDGRIWATPMLAALLVVEASDLIFAVDSIPAVLAISADPFIVYTSNIFAILGLRALYFLLAGIMGMFRFLKIGIAVILTFVGIKMLVSGFFHISIAVSLGVIAGVITLAVVASLLFKKSTAP